MKVLVIRSSIQGEHSVSTQLADEVVASLKARPEDITIRDLGAEPIPHLDGATVAAFYAAEPDARQKQLLELSNTLIAELQQADHLVLALPMYNFGVPSALKAWFDHLARVGVTFRYTEDGPRGLLEDKPVTVVATRGGLYQGTPQDSQSGFVETFFNFIGLSSVYFVYAEGLASESNRDRALSAARQAINALDAA